MHYTYFVLSYSPQHTGKPFPPTCLIIVLEKSPQAARTGVHENTKTSASHPLANKKKLSLENKTLKPKSKK